MPVKKKMFRWIRALMLMAATAMAATGAIAQQCTYDISKARIGAFSLDLGTVVVDNSVGIGEKVATRSMPIGGASNRWIADCTGPQKIRVSLQLLKGQEAITTPLGPAYSTNVPGIAYQIMLEGLSEQTFPHDYYLASAASGNTTSWYKNWTGITVNLIKTAPVVSNGPLDVGLYSQIVVAGRPSDWYFRFSISGGRIVSRTCSVAERSRNITVNLGRVPRDDFSGIGSTSAREEPFEIEIACQRAPGSLQSTVSMTMDATRPTAGRPGVMDVNPLGAPLIAARGIGIQVLDGQRRPVQFGRATQVGESKDGSYILPFVARYMQTGTAVRPGTANGTATITLTYQ